MTGRKLEEVAKSLTSMSYPNLSEVNRMLTERLFTQGSAVIILFTEDQNLDVFKNFEQVSKSEVQNLGFYHASLGTPLGF
jgi:hypothetical protein